MNTLFPVFLKLQELHTLIVGGGYVGLEKITALLENSPEAIITLVAPEIRSEIKEMSHGKKHITLIHRKFVAEDLTEKDLIIVATNDKEENKQIKKLASQSHILCNVADTPSLCDFYLSSIVQKQNLKIAISTNGLSPTIAKRIKQMLQEAFPDAIDTTMQNLAVIRKHLTGDFAKKVDKLNKITEVLITGNNLET